MYGFVDLAWQVHRLGILYIRSKTHTHTYTKQNVLVQALRLSEPEIVMPVLMRPNPSRHTGDRAFFGMSICVVGQWWWWVSARAWFAFWHTQQGHLHTTLTWLNGDSKNNHASWMKHEAHTHTHKKQPPYTHKVCGVANTQVNGNFYIAVPSKHRSQTYRCGVWNQSPKLISRFMLWTPPMLGFSYASSTMRYYIFAKYHISIHPPQPALARPPAHTRQRGDRFHSATTTFASQIICRTKKIPNSQYVDAAHICALTYVYIRNTCAV